ncbi:histidine kinase [Chitinophaga pendula]|uniref:sensor histidine kinase n=1 Tax=Chitinophaga TaxID=79328 RepID=UPI000BAFF688|nr:MULTISPECIES: histidine kinase [Chitinophaga]ASZ11446.1 hypothetical protein CK934_11000 [Chitinophaga sp. MD30]UCJ05548.1 histidine kinase [Chitinophaga pendula]
MTKLKRIFQHRFFQIGLHLVVWALFLSFPFLIYRIRIQNHWFLAKEIVDNLFLIGIFYLNIYVLIPLFFTLKKIVYYFGCVVVLMLFLIIQQATTEYLLMEALSKETGFPYGVTMPAVAISRVAPLTKTVSISNTAGVAAARPVDDSSVFSTYNVAAATPVRPTITPDVTFPPADTLSMDTVQDRPFTRVTAALPSVPQVTPGIPAIPAMPLVSKGVMLRAPMMWGRTDSLGRPLTRKDRIFFTARYFFFPEVLRRTVIAGLLMLFMSGFIKIARQWFRSEQQREELKVANLNAELRFLKSQINPHFLFNCLNTIYSLAHKRSEETENAIVKLSTIMRYMIYESNEDKVPLQKELLYLQDYIDIQRLRLPEAISVKYEVKGDPGRLTIEPMLLIPFVENAFKHGVSYAEHSFIDIDISIVRKEIVMEIRNSVFKQRVAEQGGIGLQNVRKRLELLYEDDHEISIVTRDDQFIVNLKMMLKDDQVYSSGR